MSALFNVAFTRRNLNSGAFIRVFTARFYIVDARYEPRDIINAIALIPSSFLGGEKRAPISHEWQTFSRSLASEKARNEVRKRLLTDRRRIRLDYPSFRWKANNLPPFGAQFIGSWLFHRSPGIKELRSFSKRAVTHDAVPVRTKWDPRRDSRPRNICRKSWQLNSWLPSQLLRRYGFFVPFHLRPRLFFPLGGIFLLCGKWAVFAAEDEGRERWMVFFYWFFRGLF